MPRVERKGAIHDLGTAKSTGSTQPNVENRLIDKFAVR